MTTTLDGWSVSYFVKDWDPNRLLLCRRAVGTRRMRWQHWDGRIGEWVSNPSLVEACGMGGAVEYSNCSDDRAIEIITEQGGSIDDLRYVR